MALRVVLSVCILQYIFRPFSTALAAVESCTYYLCCFFRQTVSNFLPFNFANSNIPATGKFAILESFEGGNSSLKAQLESPAVHVEDVMCLTFWYQNYGPEDGNISVYTMMDGDLGEAKWRLHHQASVNGFFSRSNIMQSWALSVFFYFFNNKK